MDLELYLYLQQHPQSGEWLYGIMRAPASTTTSHGLQTYAPKNFWAHAELLQLLATLQPPLTPEFLREFVATVKPKHGASLVVDRAWAESHGL